MSSITYKVLDMTIYPQSALSSLT